MFASCGNIQWEVRKANASPKTVSEMIKLILSIFTQQSQDALTKPLNKDLPIEFVRATLHIQYI